MISLRTALSRAALPLLALVAACSGGSGGGGCSCLAPIPGGFPTDSRRHENMVQVRVTEGAVDYLSQNGATLVSSLLGSGGMTSYPVPACVQGQSQQLCCSSGANCGINIGINGLTLAPSPPSSLALDARVKLQSMGTVQVSFTVIGITTQCNLAIDTTKGKSHQDIGFTGDLGFTVDTSTDLTSLGLNNAAIADLETAMLTLSPVSFLDEQCQLANIGFIQNILIGQIAS